MREASASWTVSDNSAANTAKTITKAAVAGKRHVVVGFEAVLKGADAANDAEVNLKQGATVMWSEAFGQGAKRGDRVGVMFSRPLSYPLNTAVELVAEAAGAGAIVKLNLLGYTKA